MQEKNGRIELVNVKSTFYSAVIIWCKSLFAIVMKTDINIYEEFVDVSFYMMKELSFHVPFKSTFIMNCQSIIQKN